MTSLMDVARQIPLGFECRSCGASAYNHVTRVARYLEMGEACCADFRDWVARAEADAQKKVAASEFRR
jgi:hypothetical protein